MEPTVSDDIMRHLVQLCGHHQQIDPLAELEARKQQAVAIEDYDAAKHWKTIADRMRTVNDELADLEHKKLEAVAIEDYDTAKTLKQDIDAVHAWIQNPTAHAPKSKTKTKTCCMCHTTNAPAWNKDPHGSGQSVCRKCFFAVRRDQKFGTGGECSHCHATYTSTPWRAHPETGKILCAACIAYLNRTNTMRPSTLFVNK